MNDGIKLFLIYYSVVSGCIAIYFIIKPSWYALLFAFLSWVLWANAYSDKRTMIPTAKETKKEYNKVNRKSKR